MKRLKLFLTAVIAMFIAGFNVNALCNVDNNNANYSITTDDGVKYCESLTDAFDNVKDNGTVTLLKEDSFSIRTNITMSKTVTLDLDGNTIATNVADNVAIAFKEINIKITDSKTGGKIVNSNEKGLTLMVAQNSTLTLEKATIESAGSRGAIQTGNDDTPGTVIIESGKVINTAGTAVANLIANGNTIINGGEVIGTGTFATIQLGTMKTSKGTLTVNGGTVLHNGTKAAIFAPYQGFEVIINGGTIKGNNSDPDQPVIMIGPGDALNTEKFGTDAKVTINNGNILGGITLTGEASKGDINGTGGNITAKGFAIAGNGSKEGSVNATINSTINISGGNITSESTAAIYHPQNGTISITGGNITGIFGIVARQGDITINGGNITATGTGEDISVGDATKDGELVKLPQGVAIIVDNSETGYEDIANVSILKGKFNVPKGKVAVLDYENNDAKKNIQISGGTFNVDVDKVYFASNDFGQSASGMVGKLHKIEIAKVENGQVETSENAVEGEEVIVKIAKDNNYEIDKIIILDKDGQEIKFVSDKYGIKFTMPMSDVTINVTFKKIVNDTLNNPQTDDKILIYLGLGIISIGIATLSVIKLKKSK